MPKQLREKWEEKKQFEKTKIKGIDTDFTSCLPKHWTDFDESMVIAAILNHQHLIDQLGIAKKAGVCRKIFSAPASQNF